MFKVLNNSFVAYFGQLFLKNMIPKFYWLFTYAFIHLF